MSAVFLHELPDVRSLFEVTAQEQGVLPVIVEKDYWIMHCLWGLQNLGFSFEMKGGTSLSKGFNIIQRFSEDIDIQIHPDGKLGIKNGKNHDKKSHIDNRKYFFDGLPSQLKISHIAFSRDPAFDDIKKMRSAGIRGVYQSHFSALPSLKPGIVLEVGFDQTTPFRGCDISSWVMEKALSLNIDIIDNRAMQVKCYLPEYTLVEKLQTVSTKYRLQQAKKQMPVNFLRHYYDIYQLLGHPQVQAFIGSDAYKAHKAKRFRSQDEKNISKNDAFLLACPSVREDYAKAYTDKSSIYYDRQPSFDQIIERIQQFAPQL